MTEYGGNCETSWSCELVMPSGPSIHTGGSIKLTADLCPTNRDPLLKRDHITMQFTKATLLAQALVLAVLVAGSQAQCKHDD